MRSFSPALLALLPLLLLACEDPTNVGLGLIGESGGEPRTVRASVESFSPEYVRDVTGGAVFSGQTNPTPRFFVGQVSDPIASSVAATGFIDFSSVSGISDAFRQGPVTAAELLFVRDYVYGDTTSTIDLDVLEIPGSWDARAPVDTVINTGALITTVSVSAATREVSIAMPAEWIETNNELLRSTDFTSDWQGVAIAPRGGNAVLGLSTASARFRVVSAGDTVNYLPSRALTTTIREAQSGPQTVVQDGSGEGLVVGVQDFRDDSDLLPIVGVNGVSVRIPVDTLAASDTPPGFVRPTLAALRLTGRAVNTAGDTLDVFVADALLSNGRYIWPIGTLPESYFQDMFGGRLRDPSLLISTPPSLFTLSPGVLTDPGTGDDGPSVVFVLTNAGI